ncbi:cytochrome c oxidase subunit I [Chitiniphilus shinanonensis]|uniref:Cytochrome c oxidase subunit I n=1 Tax=Chitiniphilus shinanonensis TaxID=553088 RepID=A0ABQ6BVW8_9NEIS|nr:COX15/CtaA family protein [Chitiniphilus shinanonensis]GLS05592.1 cytochrome c oxidase subunit I [Chitiniphilus shinanonensis]
MSQRTLQRLLWFTVGWTLVLVMLGAYVRLEDAGLGCPDWPGCYGRLTAPDSHHEIAHAEQHYGGEVDPAKGWKEMIHRYVAGGLGLLLLGQTALLWRRRAALRMPALLVVAPICVVIFQALLGMWTVTLKLMPGVVTSHLLGGMTMLALVAAQAARASPGRLPLDGALRISAWIVLAVVALQIALGGWVSTNYAALACDGFPACRGNYHLPDDWQVGFHPLRELGLTIDGVALDIDHLAAIHWIHRLWAVAVVIAVGLLALTLLRRGRRAGAWLLGALALQIGLGIANVLLGLPLPLAVAHNGGAALLLLLLVGLLARARQGETVHVQASVRPVFSTAR